MTTKISRSDMTIDTARLRALAEAATPGPWEALRESAERHSVDSLAHTVADMTGWPWAQRERDAAYIAAASPDAILRLLAERDALALAPPPSRPAMWNAAPPPAEAVSEEMVEAGVAAYREARLVAGTHEALVRVLIAAALAARDRK